jgi:imidazolonepropionase-like amidohydrolase
MKRSLCLSAIGVLVLFSVARSAIAQSGPALSPEVQRYVRVPGPLVALTHVRVVDGTGSAPKENQTVIISGDKVQSVGDASAATVPAGAQVLDLTGYTVIPGLVGMHEHMFYPSGRVPIYNEMAYSFPKLYLAAGVTTVRTGGSLEPYTDIELKHLIDTGHAAGPKMHITGPYLEGVGAFTPQMHILKDAEDARKTVNYWADEGATSFKAYMNITRDELSAAVDAAHKRGLKVTGHLCSIGFREAAAIGIDNLEHGLLVDTEFVAGKKADECPEQSQTAGAMAGLDLEGAPVQAMIHDLVDHHVAITSTLPVFEPRVPNRPPLDQRVLDAMLPEAQADYLRNRIRSNANPALISMAANAFKKEMDFERMFVKAGGTLLAGEDPTGGGGILAGFADQREAELLVEAGFTPIEALRIYSYNGAQFLGEADRIGTIAPGKAADLVVIHGDPSQNIADIEKVEIVFKDGIGYDSAKLIDAVRGSVGLH